MGSLLLIAARNLRQARRRTSLLAAALVTVSMLLVVLLSLSAGLSDTMMRVALTFSAGHINVAGFYKAKVGDAQPLIVDAAPVRSFLEQSTPHLERVIDRHRGFIHLASEQSSMQTMLMGVDVAQETRMAELLELAPERDYVDGGRDQVLGQRERLAEPRAVMIFVSQARRLGVVVGDKLTLTNETFSGQRNAVDVTVVAIAKDVGILSNYSVFSSKQLLVDVFQLRPESTGMQMVYLDDPEAIPATMAQLREALTRAGYELMAYSPEPFYMKIEGVSGEDWFGQKLDLTQWQDEVSSLAWILGAVNGVSTFLVLVLTLIIAVGVMNSMWISVRERTKEIGTLRAIGMHEGQVLVLFLAEAMMLAFFSSVAGCVLGAALVSVVDRLHIPVTDPGLRWILMSDKLHFVVNVPALLAVVAAFTVITGLAALWPAMRAARLDPIVAMQRVA